MRQQQVKRWHDDDSEHYDKGRLIKWYEGYKSRKVQKAQIKKRLIRIAWHPLRWWDWCMSKDEKKTYKKNLKVTGNCF